MINYKWDVYQFVSGFELRSLFFIRFFFIQLFLHPLFSLPIFTFHFKCGCILYCMKSNSFQFEMIACISVVRRTISVILSAPLQSFTCETNNKKPYCIQQIESIIINWSDTELDCAFPYNNEIAKIHWKGFKFQQ